MRFKSSAPLPSNVEVSRKAALLRRILYAMTALGSLSFAFSFVDKKNDWKVNVAFYGAIFVWLGVSHWFVRRGRVSTAAWSLGIFYWLIIAVVTLFFGGMQGQNASVFSVVVLLVGGIVGGRAALFMASMSVLWCGVIVFLEHGDLLPEPIVPYSPFNGLGAVLVTVLFTSVLLHESLDSLKQYHRRAQDTARERDEALRCSIQSQKMELVGNLTSGVAHDFNNLLTVVTSASESLRSSPLLTRTEDTEALDDLDDACSRAVLMTRQLLGFGRNAGEPEALNVGEVTQALGKMLPRLLGNNIQVAVDTAPDSWIHAPRVALEQIILNLAVNSRDAMPAGGTFKLDVLIEEKEVLIRAKDSGTGIAEDAFPRLFEPFFSTKVHGTGLGLSTVKRQVETAGGTIDVESQPGAGTTFTMRFPRKPAASREEFSFVASRSTKRPRPSARVVLVEDERLVRRAIARVLRSAGYDVIECADGQEALALLEATSEVACVITDLAMPRINGETLREKLAQRRPALPVLMTSGNREPSASLLKQPHTHYLGKPVTPDQLLQAISELIEPKQKLAREHELR